MVEIAHVRQSFGLSQAELARMLGYSTRTVAAWEAGEKLPRTAHRMFTETMRLLQALAELMPPQSLAAWLREPNDSFAHRAPINMIEHGHGDELWQMIHQIDANVAN